MSGTDGTRDFLPVPMGNYSREVGFPSQYGGQDGGFVPPEREVSLFDLFRVLKKRWRTAAVFTGTFFLGALLYCLLTPPLYTASTTLEIRGYAPVLSGIQSETLYGNDTRRIEYAKTTVAKLRLQGLADRVLGTDNLAEALQAYFQTRRGYLDSLISYIKGFFREDQSNSLLNPPDQHFVHKPNLIRKYLGLVDLNPVHETNLVIVSVTTADPVLSQRVANSHGEGFIAHLRNERQESMMANRELLEKQSSDLKKRVTDAEQAVIRYAEENKLVSLSQDEGNSVVIRQIEQLAQSLADVTSKRVRLESTLKELESRGIDDTSALDDEAIRTLRVSLKQAEAEYSTMGSRVTAAYPAMVELKAKIDILRKTITDERRKMLRGLKSEYEMEKSTELRLRDQIESEKGNAQDMAKRLIQYNILSKESASLRDLYQSVMKQMQETAISAAGATSNVHVSDYASLPTAPSAPKVQLILVFFTLLGLVCGAIASLVLEHLDNTFKSSDEAQTALDLPLLGVVPSFAAAGLDAAPPSPFQRLKGMARWGRPEDEHGLIPVQSIKTDHGSNGSGTDVKMITVSSPSAAVAEALRTIRASILLSSAERPPKVIMVTSAVKGDGKTTLLSNLAISLAQASHRAIAIDCDLRQSELTRLFFPHRSAKGLSDLLAGHVGVEDVIAPTTVAGLDMIPAGTRSPNPAELLGSLTMKELIHQLSGRYDFVLLDSPPVLPLADSLMLSRLVESVIMVVRGNKTARNLAQDAARRLRRVNARILGLVLNDVGAGENNAGYGVLYGDYGDSDSKRAANM